MAKPNYSFEKRQRELAKRKKKEEKVAEKNARKSTGGGQPNDDFAAPADNEAASDAGNGGTPAEGQPQP